MKSNRQFNTGVIKHTYTDEDGEVFAWCRINPTDVNLMARCEEVTNFFKENKDVFKTGTSVKEVSDFNKVLEEKIDYLLGYDAHRDLFGYIPATNISPEGDVWALVVLEDISEIIAPEVQKRKASMQNKVDNYVEKYTK